jgi:hypothetical protein
MLFGPGYWAVRVAASRALEPILGQAAEFLPLVCESGEDLVALHPVQLAELGPDTEGARNPVTGRFTWIRRYSFEPAALAGMVYFKGHEPIPFPDGSYSGVGDVLVPCSVRDRIEELGLAGCRLEPVFPVDKRRIR